MPRKSYKYIKLRAKEIIPLAKELINNKDYANLVILEDEIGFRKKAAKILEPTLNEIKEFLKNKNNSFNNFSNDIRKFIYWSNCVVLPSYREGTPRGLLEALSIGRPIITSNAVGCREVILNNKNGFLTKIKDIDSVYLAFKKFHNLDLSSKVTMSKYSRKFVSKNFDEKKVISIYEKILK